MLKKETFYATGKRKTAIARTWMFFDGSGNIEVNNRSMIEYFKIKTSRKILLEALALTDNIKTFNIKIKVKGGGISGQASAIRHGIAKALIKYDPDSRIILKKAGLITRDSRIKERKKYGQRGARARFQFSKR